MKFRIKYLIYFCLILVIITYVFDLVRISNYKKIPSLPVNEKPDKVCDVYFDLVNGKKVIDWEQLNYSLEYINAQYDVSDFEIATLIRILYEYRDKIPPEMLSKIKNTLLKFRYWMDEPGENSMCYWSENHQILYSSAEYLVGQFYPDEVFTNSGLSGKQHMAKAVIKINDWLEMRWKFGFSEFYSNVYYNEDIGGMINLIDYAADSSIVKKTEIIMDLLVYDIASHKSNNMFVSVSGRAYERSRKGGDISINRITNFLWNNTRTLKPNITYGFISSKKYHVPPALIEIGKDTGSAVVKQCNGINVCQLKPEGYFGADDKSIMMQWGMEAFSNPEVVRNSISYIRRNKMFSNSFFSAFKKLDYSLLNLFHLEPVLISIFNPQSNGTAIQQANTYTYRTSSYSLYSVQKYFPGEYAYQVHVAGMNIGNSFSVFHQHPAIPENVKLASPNYWVGYGRLPHVVQDSSISLSIYNLPDKKGIAEMAMLDFTHAYFPKELFDTVCIINNYAFGKKGDTYCAIIGSNNFYYKKNSNDDLIQQGKQTYWILEAGMKNQDGSFNSFCQRILNNKVEFNTNKLLLTYISKGKELKLTYNGDFLVNGSVINTKYGRFDSPYAKAKFKPDNVDFKFNKKFLHLDFYKMIRDCN